ncbi:uncharacterized protein LOC129602344 [Paramacrobiotus metropolitanus]|uniref:uncharacterized protein LOC129602344 n=1 Tax=Paramacrobiotus metropolitanus TaxID=2943436 RepID=UPI002445A642|nr:uncharacterized protein LOC129602344 [Paramacrobiotus metropolitanus]
MANIAVRATSGSAEIEAQYILAKRMFFQDDHLRATNRYPNRLFVLLELEQPINMERACPVCFSDRRQDKPLSDSNSYDNRAYLGECTMYGRYKVPWSWLLTGEGLQLRPVGVPAAPWDIRTCTDTHTDIAQKDHPRYLRGPSLTGFCAGGPLQAPFCLADTGAPL